MYTNFLLFFTTKISFAEVSYDGQYLIVMTTYWKGDYDLFYYHFKPNDKNYNQLKLIKLTTNRDAEYEASKIVFNFRTK